MNVKTTLSLVRGTVPSTCSASDGCVLFLLSAAAAMRTFAYSHTFLWAPSSLNSHRPFLFWVSEKRSESKRNFSCLREWKTHSRGMQSGLLQRLSSTSTLALSPPSISPYFIYCSPPPWPYTHTTLCLSLSSAGQCLWADGRVSVQMWWETAVAVLCLLSFFPLLPPPVPPLLIPGNNRVMGLWPLFQDSQCPDLLWLIIHR